MRIVIIGTGNTASVLGRALIAAGHTIVQVIGRKEESAKSIAGILNSSFSTNYAALDREADIYLIAVPDIEISNVASWLRIERKLVVHTAASVEMEELSICSKNYGVLYPLQTLRKELDYLPEIPFLVEGNTEDNGAFLFDFAGSISPRVQFATSNQRLMIHVAATMVNNFSNHLYELAENFCSNENIDFKLLLPLIQESATRIRKFSPAEMQTGPAVRNDLVTIQKHIEQLKPYPVHQEIYRLMSKSIQQWGKNKNRID